MMKLRKSTGGNCLAKHNASESSDVRSEKCIHDNASALQFEDWRGTADIVSQYYDACSNA